MSPNNEQSARTEHHRHPLDEHEAPATPFALFTTWFTEALESDIIEPNAMTLATATQAGRPSAAHGALAWV